MVATTGVCYEQKAVISDYRASSHRDLDYAHDRYPAATGRGGV
ncbi:MAG: hypothetical protein ACI9GW_003723 [Halieaceae bacterium]|jgi:hypothetical protein